MKKYFIYGYKPKYTKDTTLDKLSEIARKYASKDKTYIIGSEAYFEELMEPEDFAILKEFGDRERTECPCCGLVTNTHRPDYRGEHTTSRYSSCGFCISLEDKDYFDLKGTYKVDKYIIFRAAKDTLSNAILEAAQINYTGELNLGGIDILENVYENSNMISIADTDLDRFRDQNKILLAKESIDTESSSSYYVHRCYGRHYHMEVFVPKMPHGIVEILFSKTK